MLFKTYILISIIVYGTNTLFKILDMTLNTISIVFFSCTCFSLIFTPKIEPKLIQMLSHPLLLGTTF